VAIPKVEAPEPDEAAAPEGLDELDALAALGSGAAVAAPAVTGAAGGGAGAVQRCPQCTSTVPASATKCSCGYDFRTKRGPATASGGSGGGGGSFLQNASGLPLGCALSFGGALVGAAVWAIVAIVADVQLGYIAWGVGILAGAGMSIGNRDTNATSGIASAAFAIVGVILAKIFIFFYVVAAVQKKLGVEIPSDEMMSVFFRASFGVIDILFVVLAVGSAYRLGMAGFGSKD
jgi:hypothetical protein